MRATHEIGTGNSGKGERYKDGQRERRIIISITRRRRILLRARISLASSDKKRNFGAIIYLARVIKNRIEFYLETRGSQ